MSDNQRGSVDIVSQVVDEGYSHYALDAQETAFFEALTGISDDGALREHIAEIQSQAYQVHRYPCIRWFGFTKFKISRLPVYERFLELGRLRKEAIFLDIGCCFGNDVRKAIVDGFPLDNTLATDLEPDFWKLGHKLFNSSPDSFHVPFLPGDVFDSQFLPPVPPFYSLPHTSRPVLASISTLEPLLGHVSAIHASSLFHLFDEVEQLRLAQAVAGLLSPMPGSMIFGAHNARPEKGLRMEATVLNTRGKLMFCHSPDSWTALWDGEVFKRGTVKVETRLREIQRDDLLPRKGSRFWTLDWSIIRL